MQASTQSTLVGMAVLCCAFSVFGQTQINLPAPIVQETFESVNEGELPAGWTVINYTDDITSGQDLDNPTSDSYKDWVVISRDRVVSIGAAGRWEAPIRLNVAPNQFVNGVLVTNLAVGKFIYAESDQRGGSQAQYLFSPDFNLAGKSNVYVVYNSIYEQNQDSIGAVEYSIDGGTNWLPIIYMIDAADILRDASGNVDALATLNEPRTDTAAYVDPVTGAAAGGSYGAFIGAPISTNLTPFISGRVNDDAVESKRVEVFRISAADNQAKVRFRFAQAGTGSWYFGIDNFGLYSIAPAVDHPNKPAITAPAKVDFFANTTLTGSPFQGSNASEKHSLSVWQISSSTGFSATDGFSNVQESISSTNSLTSLVTKLQTIFPGRTYYATVQYRDQNGAKSEFADPVSFNVDILPAPIVFENFESTPPGNVPAGWTVSNQTDGASGDLDPASLGSDTYLDWTVIAFDQLSTFGGGRGDTNVAIGNSIYAESDTRSENQIQFINTTDFSTLGKSNVWAAFRSNYEQNQDSFGGFEYSVDGGATWLPVLYMIDRDDIKSSADGSVDATATLTTTADDVAKILDPATGERVAAGKFEDFILARPVSSLGPYISGRINDNATESKRYERFRLPTADNQAKVKLRFVQAGTGSWYWGVDDLGLYALAGAGEPPPLLVPGAPEDNGLAAKTATFYINTTNTLNNANTESLGVAIASNGNVIVGWEDDGDGLTDLEAVWTMFDNTGNSITPDTQITTINPDFTGQTLTSKFLSFFRADKSAIAGRTSWGPKIHANLFGEGIGMGATSFELGIEVPELANINVDAGGGGDFPSVQLLGNDGKPIGIVTGVSDADAEPEGDIRIADWEYLSDGNIVVVGESRQGEDLVSKYGGSTAANHAIYRIVDQTGKEVRAVGLVSESPEGSSEIWHGAAATKNGFAVRFAQGGRAIIRLFDNAGKPASTNLDLGTVAKDEAAAGGGRGDGAGFHGNGNDAYVAVNGAGNQVRLTVLNADGTLRYSRSAVDDLPLKSVGRTDAAISPSGQVLVVFSATYDGGPVTAEGTDISVVMGRLFDASGNPSNGTFYVSEKEVPSAAPLPAQNPRVGWRGDMAVIVWESQNSGEIVDDKPLPIVAARFFSIGGTPVTALTITDVKTEGAGLTLTWTGGTGPFLVQKKASISDPGWINVVATAERSATVSREGNAGFFRVVDQAQTEVLSFTASLSGAAERPNPVTTTGTGVASLTLTGNTLTYQVSYEGLSGTATAAHIHGPAGPEVAAGVLVPLTPVGAFGSSGTLAGSATLTAEQKAALLGGQTYVNIHTAANGGGEIRGQTMPVVLKVNLNGASERPNPVVTSGTGSGILTLIGNQLTYDISYSGLSGPATAAHIHGPAGPEVAAGVLFPLTPVGAFGASGRLAGTVTLTADQLAAIAGGLTYANVHTAANGGGEIRGQINPNTTGIAFTAALSGAAERPNPVNTTGTGVARLTLEGDTLTYQVSYEGLSGTATAAHIHGPAGPEVAAGVLVPLTPVGAFGSSGALAGAMTLTADQKAALLGGQTYVNIHTAANGGGEIRGQAVPVVLKVSLSGAAERPNPVNTTATASGILTLIGSQLTYDIGYSGLSGAATAAHIHGPAGPEAAAGVLFPLSPVGAFGVSGRLAGTVTLTADQLTALAGGLTYANIHTAANGGGEIRGQINLSP